MPWDVPGRILTSLNAILGKGGECMSKQAVEQVIRKASTDARFRAQLAKDFEIAVKPFKLTAAEKAQLRKGAGVPATAKVPERQAARATARATARLTDRATARLTDRATARLTDRATARLTERATARLTDRATARLTDRATARVTDRVTARVTDRVTARVTGET
jgi:hypothetical protein